MKQNKKLGLKFILGYAVVGILSFLLISTFGSDYVEAQLERIAARSMYHEASRIADDFAASYNGRMASLNNLSDRLKGIAEGSSSTIWIISDDGTIYYDSAGNEEGKKIENFHPASFGKKSKISYMDKGKFFDMFHTPMLSVLATIHVNYTTKGYVALHRPLASFASEQYDVLNIVYMTGLVIYLLSLFVFLIYRFTVSKPLKEITKAADAYASGDLNYVCPVKSKDEMGYLSATLNYMASELNNTEQYQKKFISNVSHDFRSPLTSIRGYLVAIQDGTIPPELYDRYLGIIIKETDRLTKLTEGLLSLNQMNGPSSLSYSVFDINKTIRETCEAFEGKCVTKHLTFELTFSLKQMFVYADYAKIQQVLYNLIDNAIKFSKNDTQIQIRTREKNNRVFVSVKDHGCGISRENQKKIFERFFKADNSRGKDKQGTGLGLAITKEIITAHKQTIDVISTEGVGTEFVFTLDRSKLGNDI